MHLFASRRMDGKTSQLMSWFLFQELLPVLVMTALYSRDVYTLWFKQQVTKMLSYKYSRFSLLLASRERQKFHTDDVKSVENLVRNSDWLTQELYCFTYCLPMTDKRQKATKVKCNVMNLLQKSQYSWNLLFFRKIIRVLLELFRRRTQNFTIIDQEKYKNMQILIYVISMEFLSQRRQRPSWRKVPSGEKQGKTTVFSGQKIHSTSSPKCLK